MKIMVVEDDENSRIKLSDLLDGQGHVVSSAQNGKIAEDSGIVFKDGRIIMSTC